MSKTCFTKAQLILLHGILTREQMIPCDKIAIYTDPCNSSVSSVYNVVKFVKGKKQVNIGFITRTSPKNDKLKEQLYHFFGGEDE